MSDFSTFLNDKVNDFLHYIDMMTSEGYTKNRDERIRESAFSIFYSDDFLYRKKIQQRDLIENYIRTQLVNDSFDFLFKKYNYDVRWRCNLVNISVFGTNQEHEYHFPAEFIIVLNNKVSAVRYTPCEADYSIIENLPGGFEWSLKNEYRIDHIDNWISLQFSKDNTGKNSMPLREFFEKYFSIEEYNIFFERISMALEIANHKLMYKMIEYINPNNYNEIKKKIRQNLLSVNFSDLKYIGVDLNGNVNETFVAHLCEDDAIKLLSNNFLIQNRYLLLVGSSKFATSFVTSEYLSLIFNIDSDKYNIESSIFDHTSIVSGYIKSVEQLCTAIVYDLFLPLYNQNMYILANDSLRKKLNDREISKEERMKLMKVLGVKNIKNFYYISMLKDNESFFATELTLGNLIHFMEINKKILFEEIFQKDLNYFFKIIKNYLDFDRNGYFHFHNMSKSKAARIKNNTIVILYWILGALKMPKGVEWKKVLGIVDNTFETFYKRLACYQCLNFYIEYEKETFYATKIMTKNNSYYAENGVLKNAFITFIKIDKPLENWLEYQDLVKNVIKDKMLIINEDNVPLAVYQLNNDGATELIFKKNN